MLLYIDNGYVVPFNTEEEAKEWGLKGKPTLELTQEEFDAAEGHFKVEGKKILVGKQPDEINKEKADEVRRVRDIYLADTDKYLLSDFPLEEAEKKRVIAYRDYLRNIPQDKQFPDVTVKTLEEF